MPNIPPKKPFRQVPSSERLKQMLTGSMTGAMPSNAMAGTDPSSLRDAAMRNYEYNPNLYSPEERRALEYTLNENNSRVFPSRDDIPGEYYAAGLFGRGDSYRQSPDYARQDSLYEARKVKEAADLNNQTMIGTLVDKLSKIFGQKNVRVER